MDFVAQFRVLFRRFSENELLLGKSSFSQWKFFSENTAAPTQQQQTAAVKFVPDEWYLRLLLLL